MYSQEIILALEKRIGWENSSSTSFGFEISEQNLMANSGRKVNMFHQLAIVDNIHAAVSEIDMEPEEFNGFLSSIRNQATREVLTRIMDRSKLYDSSYDYSVIIQSKIALFDDPIGYCIAIKILELFISSSRSNLLERNAKLSFQSLKLELEGVRNDSGVYVAQGIVNKYEKSIQEAQKIIFKEPILIIKGKDW